MPAIRWTRLQCTRIRAEETVHEATLGAADNSPLSMFCIVIVATADRQSGILLRSFSKASVLMESHFEPTRETLAAA